MTSNTSNTEGGVRLNKFIANSGVCSRREADKIIESGRISINGEVVTQLGSKVQAEDVVELDGNSLKGEQNVYVLLNKPKGFITTLKDPEGRRTVMELVNNATDARIFPVGRLDRNTTGLLLFTNDGELANKLMHPSTNIGKIYRVFLDQDLEEGDGEKIMEGIELDDGFIKADAFAQDEQDPSVAGIEIHSGKNRIVRRIFEHFGYKVKYLDRITFAGLTKKDLPRGKYRFLDEKEVRALKGL